MSILKKIFDSQTLQNLPAVKGKDGIDGKRGLRGLKGSKGDKGLPGKDGQPGKPGVDGKPGAPGKDGKDGKDGVTKIIKEQVEIELTPKEIKEKLESLKDDKRLDASAIKNLPNPINNYYGGGSSNSGGSTTWGSITGTLSNQTDLQVALDSKIDLNGTNSNIDHLNFNPTSAPAYQQGRVWYDNQSRALSYYDEHAGTSIQIGKELVVDARNNTGSTIANGSVVYISGAVGQAPTMALAQANSISTSEIIGVATHDITNNSVGKVTILGMVNDIDTSAFTNGQQVYLSASVAGGLTATPPASPGFVTFVGYVAHAHAVQGKLLVITDRTIANNNSLGTSQILAPTQNAVKTYVDNNTHAPVTVTDSSTIDFTLTGQNITASVIPGGLNLQDLGGAVTDAQVPNTITLDNITQVTNRSHTALSDIGTNTHTQIDTHIANTSNPHSVTKTQVGLANVTNDAQLKIASNLSDLASASTARTNLGLGTAAVTNTGTSSGNVPVLDGTGKLSSGVLPAIAVTNTFVVASQAAMLALTAETGDIAIRTDLTKTFILQGTDPTILANWQEILAPTGAVPSVFGRTGAVTAQTDDYTWAQINKTTSNIADITTKSHTSLTDIGTNTHAQIDTHIASTSNPHSVTKTQVGLGNVTDDAQLKRAAADFTSFTAKTTPVAADTFLIEDSAASDAKKKTTVAQVNAVLDHNTLAGKQGGLSTDFHHIGSTMYNNLYTASARTFLVRGEGSVGAMNDRTVATGGAIDFTTSAEPKISDAFASIVNYRLSLTSGTPVTTADVTAATTLYITPYRGNTIGLQTNTGSYWAYLQPNEVSLALSAFNLGGGSVANTNYDIYVQQNGTSVTPHAIPWTNATTRNVSFTMVNGIPTFGASYSYGRYIGTVRTTAANQLEDSESKRFVYNYYNKVQKRVKRIESTDSWTYDTAAWRQSNGSALNQVEIVQGVAEDIVEIEAMSLGGAGSNVGARCYTGIGVDSTTTNSADLRPFFINQNSAVVAVMPLHAKYKAVPVVGYHYYAWLERGDGIVGTNSWRGDNADATIMQAGMLGWCWC